MDRASFSWDETKNRINQGKHNVSFEYAQRAFDDSRRVIVRDLAHERNQEERFFCLGKVEGSILTVRFSYRGRPDQDLRGRVLEKGKEAL